MQIKALKPEERRHIIDHLAAPMKVKRAEHLAQVTSARRRAKKARRRARERGFERRYGG